MNQSADKKPQGKKTKKAKKVKKLKRNNQRAKPLSELVGGILEPIIAKRAGMTLSLMNAWADIIGGQLGKHSRPEKILWPRRAHDDDPFQPATLVVACDGAQAIFFQHETDAIIERVNTYFGFNAIGRIKIQQKPVANYSPKKSSEVSHELDEDEKQRLAEMVGNIEDEELRKKLTKLGKGIILRHRDEDQS